MTRILWQNSVGDYYIADIENNMIVAQSDALTKADVDGLESLYDYQQLVDRDGHGDDDDDMQPIKLTTIHTLHKIEA